MSPSDTVDFGLGQGRQVGPNLIRGIIRQLEAEGWSAVSEVTLATGRRVDVLAVDDKGRLLIIEVKSSLADFQADHKWTEYLDFADSFAFGVDASFPIARLPEDCGVMIADRYGGDWLRPPQSLGRSLAAARRKAMLIRFATVAARRLRRLEDPDPSGQ